MENKWPNRNAVGEVEELENYLHFEVDCSSRSKILYEELAIQPAFLTHPYVLRFF